MLLAIEIKARIQRGKRLNHLGSCDGRTSRKIERIEHIKSSRRPIGEHLFQLHFRCRIVDPAGKQFQQFIACISQATIFT
jgi:hypothetical protein